MRNGLKKGVRYKQDVRVSLREYSIDQNKMDCVSGPYLKNISPCIVLICPSKSVQDLQDLFMFQDGEESIEKNLESDWCCMCSVQQQAGNVQTMVEAYCKV